MTYRKQEVARSVYEMTMERVNVLYDRYDKVVVMFSGGKDSTVCLQTTLEVARARGRLPLEVIFWDEEAIPPETIDYVARVAAWPEIKMRWLCMPVKHRNGCSKQSPYWYPWAPEDQAKWCRELPPSAITDIPGWNRPTIPEANGFLHRRDEGQVAAVTGIRAGESLRRYHVVTQRSHDNWITVDGSCNYVYQAKPIYDWTTEDVWTAPRNLGWDFNGTYTTMERAGIPRSVQRVAPPYGEEPLQRLWMYAVCWPELWEKMCRRVPGAATAGRYSRSPLYSFNTKFRSPPPGMTWEEAIRHQLMRWPEDYRKQVARRIQSEIAKHNRETRGAVIPDVTDEGLSWSFLYMLAVRGDLKNRKQVPHKSVVTDAEALADSSPDVREDRMLGDE